jgi:predicted enzyme related to lactoylglutathione lyase
MPFYDAHQPGMFCWVELATTDLEGAKKFYQNLFGWGVNETPIGEGMMYAIFRYKDRDTGAAYTQMADQAAQGVPPNWLNYIAVESVDEVVGRVAGLGGTVIAPPMDVMDHGRMAVIMDPTGAAFAVWQPKKHAGMGIQNEPGAWCWAELVTKDTAAAKKFYTSLFGYSAEAMPMAGMPGAEYTLLKLGEKMVGGVMPPPQPGMPSFWLAYFAVADCDATVEKAKATGAHVHQPPTDIPNVGRFATLSDPQGAAFAVLQPVPVPA